MSWIRRSLILVMVGMLLVGGVSCRREGPAERTGRAIDEAVEDTGRAIEDATD